LDSQLDGAENEIS